MLRICRRNGWSIERDWDSLSEWEQTEWLAYDRFVQAQVEQAEQRLMNGENLYTPEVFVALLLTRL